MAGKGRGNNNPFPLTFNWTTAVRMSISFPAGNHRALKAFGQGREMGRKGLYLGAVTVSLELENSLLSYKPIKC